MITKRKINRIFSAFPYWSPDDISCLIMNLSERKRRLIETRDRFAANQERKRRFDSEIAFINKGLIILYSGKYKTRPKYLVLQTLFENYLGSELKIEKEVRRI